MPTITELNLASGSNSLVTQREPNSGVILINPKDTNVSVKIENKTFEFDNASINEHIDTAFSYYKFPARIVVDGVDNINLQEQLQNVTIENSLFYRYQASKTELPNLDINTVGAGEIKLVRRPAVPFMFINEQAWDFGGSQPTSDLVAQNGGDTRLVNILYNWQLVFDPETGIKDYDKEMGLPVPTQLDLDRSGPRLVVGRNAGNVWYVDVIMGIPIWVRSIRSNRADLDSEGFRMQLQSIENEQSAAYKQNPLAKGLTGNSELILGYWSGGRKNVDFFKIYEEPLLDENGVFDLTKSFFVRMYNQLRYTRAGRRLIELDQIAKDQVANKTSKGRYKNSSNSDNEFKTITFKEYDWQMGRSGNGLHTYIWAKNYYTEPVGNHPFGSFNRPVNVRDIQFKLNYNLDSIINSNFEEIKFNKVIDGAQQLENRFIINKEVVNFNTDIWFKINIGLNHLNEKSTFVIRLIRYDGLNSKDYTIVKQTDHRQCDPSVLVKTGETNDKQIALTKQIAELKEDIRTIEGLRATAVSAKSDFDRAFKDAETLIAEKKAEYTKLEEEYNDNISSINVLNKNIETYKNLPKVIAPYIIARDKLIERNKVIGPIMQSLDEELGIYRQDIYLAEGAAYLEEKKIKTYDTNITEKNKLLKTATADLNAIGKFSDLIDTLLGETSYIKPGKSIVTLIHKIPKNQLNLYDSYAVEILTNSPTKNEDIFPSIIGVPTELIDDLTSWEVLPNSLATQKLVTKWNQGDMTYGSEAGDAPMPGSGDITGSIPVTRITGSVSNETGN